MDVYVETNFVLELALLQEQQQSCQKLLDLAEARRINLILPAFSLTEPYETLIRREKNRRNLSLITRETIAILNWAANLDYIKGDRTRQRLMIEIASILKTNP